MLANWNPSDRTKEILAELRVAFLLLIQTLQVRAGALFADKDFSIPEQDNIDCAYMPLEDEL